MANKTEKAENSLFYHFGLMKELKASSHCLCHSSRDRHHYLICEWTYDLG